jgi:hypothetical protein
MKIQPTCWRAQIEDDRRPRPETDEQLASEIANCLPNIAANYFSEHSQVRQLVEKYGITAKEMLNYTASRSPDAVSFQSNSHGKDKQIERIYRRDVKFSYACDYLTETVFNEGDYLFSYIMLQLNRSDTERQEFFREEKRYFEDYMTEYLEIPGYQAKEILRAVNTQADRELLAYGIGVGR